MALTFDQFAQLSLHAHIQLMKESWFRESHEQFGTFSEAVFQLLDPSGGDPLEWVLRSQPEDSDRVFIAPKGQDPLDPSGIPVTDYTERGVANFTIRITSSFNSFTTAFNVLNPFVNSTKIPNNPHAHLWILDAAGEDRRLTSDFAPSLTFSPRVVDTVVTDLFDVIGINKLTGFERFAAEVAFWATAAVTGISRFTATHTLVSSYQRFRFRSSYNLDSPTPSKLANIQMQFEAGNHRSRIDPSNSGVIMMTTDEDDISGNDDGEAFWWDVSFVLRDNMQYGQVAGNPSLVDPYTYMRHFLWDQGVTSLTGMGAVSAVDFTSDPNAPGFEDFTRQRNLQTACGFFDLDPSGLPSPILSFQAACVTTIADMAAPAFAPSPPTTEWERLQQYSLHMRIDQNQIIKYHKDANLTMANTLGNNDGPTFQLVDPFAFPSIYPNFADRTVRFAATPDGELVRAVDTLLVAPTQFRVHKRGVVPHIYFSSSPGLTFTQTDSLLVTAQSHDINFSTANYTVRSGYLPDSSGVRFQVQIEVSSRGVLTSYPNSLELRLAAKNEQFKGHAGRTWFDLLIVTHGAISSNPVLDDNISGLREFLCLANEATPGAAPSIGGAPAGSLAQHEAACNAATAAVNVAALNRVCMFIADELRAGDDNVPMQLEDDCVRLVEDLLLAEQEPEEEPLFREVSQDVPILPVITIVVISGLAVLFVLGVHLLTRPNKIQILSRK